jgi:hypothetical protein
MKQNNNKTENSFLLGKWVGITALAVSALAMFSTAFQSFISWKTMDRSIEANILQIRLTECGKLIGKAQVFSSRDAEFRVALSAKIGKIPSNLQVMNIPKEIPEIKLEEMRISRKSAAAEFLESTSASYFLFNPDEQKKIIDLWHSGINLLSKEILDELNQASNPYNSSIKNLINSCSMISARFGAV